MAYYCFSLANPSVPSSFLQRRIHMYARPYVHGYNVYNARREIQGDARETRRFDTAEIGNFREECFERVANFFRSYETSRRAR